MKETVIELLQSTHRENIETLIEFLEKSDFFTAPASVVHHLAYPGGLVEHSLNVYNCAKKLNKKYEHLFSDDSVTIISLLHDVCKVNYYEEVNENPTDPQRRYLASLMNKAGLEVPVKLNKTYASILIDFMIKQYKGDKVIPAYVRNYQVKDQLPLGHGEKSLYIISQYIELTPEEALQLDGIWELGT